MIEMTVRRDYNADYLNQLSTCRRGKFLSLQMFFCRPGIIREQSGMDDVLTQEDILNGRFLLNEGTEVVCRENSTQRAGYFIATGRNPYELNTLISQSYRTLHIGDPQGHNMIQLYERMMFPYD